MTTLDASTVGAAPEASTTDRLEQVGLVSVLGVAGAVHVSIAVAQLLAALAMLSWLAVLISRRERFSAPRFFWPLAALGVATLVSAAFSPQPATSLVDTKQLLLFLLVPVTYRFITAERADTLLTAALSIGAASAAFGIFQYGILHYDQLSQRPQGTLGHYMTYSGLLMLMIGTALARIVFARRDRAWAAMVIPALTIAIVLTFTRSAWVGACVAAALVFALRDFRLVAIVPVAAALMLAVAPGSITQRFVSIFNLRDPTNRDRLAMMREGAQMIRTHPLVGVGPNMVPVVYDQYRDPDAVQAVNPHLHNVPLQIAAERGLPAALAWLAFVGVLVVDLARLYRMRVHRPLVVVALASVAAMLSAGFFEYNFGDSEFLMMFLLLVTLPFAAARAAGASHA